ncbi:type II toxin-antitoxin system RelE/ParE family toxin [Salinarimonas sp. NSM]|uniref:type II toxin-antitoxin system RelE/ParE family toxin n=1 Tax=Salinarimonas sp. NSM TaxID=3458003 RepID=UPI0040371640
MPWRLTKKAEDDLVRVVRESRTLFGSPHAEAYARGLHKSFDFLAEHPKAAREREDIVPPVRVHPFRSHLIVYRILEGGEVAIIRIRHAREDWIMDPT